MINKQAALEIIHKLRDKGFEAFLAGGCVRDMLLDRPASDYDVATSAKPRDIIRLFKKTITIAAHFGVVIVVIKGLQVEVATFRSETGYADGRHPSDIKFVDALEDASRRDFTINGMFYDPLEEKIIDYVNGQDDLKKKVVRTIGDPQLRFSEDYLRMLRAVRFSAQLDFKIEPSTWAAIHDNAPKIAKISGERIQIELEYILINPNRFTGAVMLIKSGLAEAIFPEFTGEKAGFAIEVLGKLTGKVDFSLALSAFFAGCQTKFALEKCVILMLSKNQNKHIKFLLKNRDILLKPDMSLAELKKIAVEPYFVDLYELQSAIQKARGKSLSVLEALQKRIKDLGDIELKPKALLNGHDLVRLGAVPGPALGQLAEEMYVAQLEEEIQTEQQAEKWVLNWLQKHRLTEN